MFKWTRPALFSFIDFFAMTGAKHDNVVAHHVEDNAIITDTEPVAAEFWARLRDAPEILTY